VAGAWGGSSPGDAAAVLMRMRQACLAGVRLVSDRQPSRIRVEDHSSGPPAVWLHADPPETAWVIVDIGPRDWSKLAYQFGHELGHVLCNSWARDAKPAVPCQWIEEALVESFSLRGLALVANSWQEDPPFPGDSGFATALRRYRLNVLRTYAGLAGEQGAIGDMRGWFAAHRAFLDANGGLNEGAQAAVPTFLSVLSSDDAYVAELGALNRWPGRSGVPVERYFELWLASCEELGCEGGLPTRLGQLLLG
jgi:hypothetical protein